MKTHRILIIALCFIGVNSLRAQTYTPVAYNFGPVFEVGDGSGGDTATDISMDCLAANGYGQWTASYKTANHFDSGSPGLFLLANGLRAPSSPTSTYVVSTGIVSFRPFEYLDSTGYPVDNPLTNKSVVKNATNLKGRVRYVWPSADHSTFIVEGFDECPANGNPAGLKGINLEFASYPYNTTYGTGNQHLGKDVIKAPSAVQSNTLDIPLTHPVVSAAYEQDPRDWFAVSMDTMNLYVVYEEYDSTGQYNIWEITQQLDNGSIAPAIKVASGARRPTIAADVRRELPDTLAKACFDVAYITGTTSSDHLTWYNYDGSRIPAADTMVMAKSFQDTSGLTLMYKKVLHACMLDATWEGITSSDTTPRAIYVIVTDPAGSTHLVLHKIKGGAQDATAYYCDGNKVYNHAAGVNDWNFPVVDKPIRAFVNAYDGEKDYNFDEYHCMYQLARTYTGGSHKPLMTIHGAVVHDTLGPRACLNFAGSKTTPGTVMNRPDTLHRFYADPGLNLDGGDTDNYVGAVNQMGIHWHWRSGAQHYYMRDLRKFDEDIEENTLATEDIYIADGTSHGGTIGATVQPGKTMTLWTGDTITNVFPVGTCTLHFPSTGSNANTTELKVGTGTDTSSKLVGINCFYMDCHASTQYLHIKANSSFELEGDEDNLFTHTNGGVWLDGTGASMTGGPNGWPESISQPATLNIHGNSDFDMEDSSSFISSNGIINVLHDQNYMVDTESYTSGFAPEIWGSCKIDSSIIIRQDTSYADEGGENGDLFEIHGSTYGSNDTNSIINSYFRGGQISQLDDGSGGIMLPLMISGGKFVDASLKADPTPHGATIQNVIFDSVTFNYAISIFPASTASNYSYDFITIQNCNFKKLPDGGDGILATNFANDSSIMEHLHILSDTFAYDNSPYPHAAIELQNSEAFIQGNQITGGGFQYGIIVTGASDVLSGLTRSLICTNYITSGGIAGIATDNTAGYCKMNTVTVYGTGHLSGANDQPHIIFSNYSSSGGTGLTITDQFAAPDLSGVHSVAAHEEDYAAFDTIWSNTAAQITLVKNANIYLGTGLEVPSLWVWSDWSHNNILDFYSRGGCSCTTTVFGPLIIADSGRTNTTQIGNISRNYFGDTAILPENDTVSGCTATDTFGTPSTWRHDSSPLIVANGFCFNADSNFKTWQDRIPGVIDCEESLPAKAKQKGANSQSNQIYTNLSCQEKYALGHSYDDENEYDSGYIYLKEYMETCYDTGQAWHAFVDLDDAVQHESTDPSRYENFREWLKSILWLNQTDPEWYCGCVRSILFSYRWDTAANGFDYNAAMAIQYYIQSVNHCPDDSAYFANGDTGTRGQQRQLWLDTVREYHHGDTTDFPEDTTLPTLQQLGMEILLDPPAKVDTSSSPQTAIGSLTASENPFTKETTVSFSMGEYAYVSFQVFDVLGMVVQGDYKGRVIGPGEHSFTVDGTNLPSGTYYARITTPIGETLMIKLVKE